MHHQCKHSPSSEPSKHSKSKESKREHSASYLMCWTESVPCCVSTSAWLEYPSSRPSSHNPSLKLPKRETRLCRLKLDLDCLNEQATGRKDKIDISMTAAYVEERHASKTHLQTALSLSGERGALSLPLFSQSKYPGYGMQVQSPDSMLQPQESGFRTPTCG
jgi:hypothetical protein